MVKSNTSRSVSPRPKFLPRLLTVNNGCSAAASSRMHLQANHAPRVTPPIAHASCRNPEHTRDVYSSTIATPVKRKHRPRICCPHTTSAMNRQLWLRQVLPAPGAEIPSQKRNSKFNISIKPEISNSKFGIPNHNMITNAAHTAARAPASVPPPAAVR